MTLNSALTESQAIEQLNIAREDIIKLQESLVKFADRLKKYQTYEKFRERRVSCSVEFMLDQLRFLRQADELFIDIVVQDDKIVRLEAKQSLT